jgi:hypothetical protein
LHLVQRKIESRKPDKNLESEKTQVYAQKGHSEFHLTSREEGCEKTGRVYSYYFIIKRQNLKAGDMEEQEYQEHQVRHGESAGER